MFDFCIKNTGVLASSHCLLLIILHMPQPPYFLRMDNYPYSTRQAEFKLNTLLCCHLKVTSDGAKHRASFSKTTNSVMSGFVTVSQEKQAMETETCFSTAGQQIYSLFLFRLNEMLFQELLPRSTAEFTGSQHRNSPWFYVGISFGVFLHRSCLTSQSSDTVCSAESLV